jgi:thymidylate synthase ThyX
VSDNKYRLTVQYQDFQLDFLEAPMGRLNLTQNELSGRYRTIPTRYFGCPDDVANILSKAVGDCEEYSPETAAEDFDQELERQANWYSTQMSMLKRAKAEGRIAETEYKRAREIMRGILGTSFITEMRLVANLHALEWILEQRLKVDTQPESRELAMKIYYALVEADVAPIWREETMKRLGY